MPDNTITVTIRALAVHSGHSVTAIPPGDTGNRSFGAVTVGDDHGLRELIASARLDPAFADAILHRKIVTAEIRAQDLDGVFKFGTVEYPL